MALEVAGVQFLPEAGALAGEGLFGWEDMPFQPRQQFRLHPANYGVLGDVGVDINQARHDQPALSLWGPMPCGIRPIRQHGPDFAFRSGRENPAIPDGHRPMLKTAQQAPLRGIEDIPTQDKPTG